MRRASLLTAAILGSLLAACRAAQPPADLVLRGGRIITVDAARPVAEALAIGGDRILAVGSAEEIAQWIGPRTQVLSIPGAVAVPGFIEGHGHFHGLGRSLATIDLRGARTWPEIVERVTRAALEVPAGQWIVGWGWHQEKWSEPPLPAIEGYPVHEALTRATPRHPVLLSHASGHAGLLNALGLARVGLEPAGADPAGGRVLRDRAGHPTGVLLETAYERAKAAYEAELDARGPDEVERAGWREIELASERCLARGVTSFQDAGSSFATIDRLKRAAEQGRLPVRLWIMIEEDNRACAERLAQYRLIDVGDHRLTVRAIKRYADGALGSRGAWLLAPYDDLPATSGLVPVPLAEIEQTAALALEHGFQLCTHAIGDRANHEILDLYERSGARDRRWRIEHAQHLDPRDVPRFAALGVVASMQPVHCTSDASWVPARLGAQRASERSYLWRSLIDAGAVVSSGTDTPVEEVDPIANFYAAVTRRAADGTAFSVAQRMTRREALEAATIKPAYAAFEETIKGSLTPGKLADVAVLSQDLLEVPEDRIPATEVLYTIVGGRIVYTSSLRRGHEP